MGIAIADETIRKNERELQMSELSDKLDTLSFTIESTHTGLHLRELAYMDRWECTITYEGRSLTTEYHSGIGHRKCVFGVKKVGQKYQDKYANTYANSDLKAARAGYTKPVAPKLADVLSCLLSDANSGQETFIDFCANFGYDTNSRKHLEIYSQCQKTLVDLRHMLGYDLLTELSQLEH